MACKACERSQMTEFDYPFRWGNGNVAVRGCVVHVTEIFNVLRENLQRATVVQAPEQPADGIQEDLKKWAGR